MTFFISKKFLQEKKKSQTFSLLSSITIIGIAIGVAALIITLSILQGFEKSIQEKLVNLDSHIQIVGFGELPLSQIEKNSEIITEVVGNELRELSKVISELTVVRFKNYTDGMLIRGVENNYFVNKQSLNIKEGSSESLFIENENNIVIGKILADRIQAKLGDKITIFALSGNEIPSSENPPIIEQFIISGIFESGVSKYDDSFAFISFNKAQTLFNFFGKISSYEIQLNNIEKVDSLANQLQEALRHPHFVKTFFDTNRQIFTWLELHKKPIPIVLGLIILVAVFNIISTLLMLILEKRTTIGTIKAMGGTNFLINKIFLLQGFVIAIVGTLLGNTIAFSLLIIQDTFNIISLPSAIYFISTVPISFDWKIYLMVSLISVALCLVSAIVPSWMASRTKIVNSLRFE